MYAQFFGNYLLSHGVVTREQLLETMHRKSSTKIKLGTLAIHAGYMTANEVDRIVILQTHEDKRFGELAIHEGYLTEEEVTKLLAEQKPDFLLLGQALVDEGLINNQQLQELIIDYQSENELDDYSYSEEDQNAIRHMIENFFILAERPLSKYEISFFQLLFNNLYRFIGDDFTLVSPSSCKEYPTNYCVSQKVSGSFSIRTYLDIPENTCIAFASKYVNENFTEFDEYVRSSVEDFINLHNGLFCVNMSNEFSMNLSLEAPVVEEKDLLTFEHETYLLPVLFPFGTLHFIFRKISLSKKIYQKKLHARGVQLFYVFHIFILRFSGNSLLPAASHPLHTRYREAPSHCGSPQSPAERLRSQSGSAHPPVQNRTCCRTCGQWHPSHFL